LTTFTDAFGTTAPLESLTVPRIDPVNDCATAAATHTAQRTANDNPLRFKVSLLSECWVKLTQS
jgi:hypothetical protein